MIELLATDPTAFGLAVAAIALAIIGLWRGYAWASLASARDVEERAREVIESMDQDGPESSPEKERL